MKEINWRPLIWRHGDVISGKYRDQFIVESHSGGAGTSSNMNANRVVANIAIEKLVAVLREAITALSTPKPAMWTCSGQPINITPPHEQDYRALSSLQATVSRWNAWAGDQSKIHWVWQYYKVGRTQLQMRCPCVWAEPSTLTAPPLTGIPSGWKKNPVSFVYCEYGRGTAIGATINANPEYLKRIPAIQKKTTSFNMVGAGWLIDATQTLLDASACIQFWRKRQQRSLCPNSQSISGCYSSGPKTSFTKLIRLSRIV